MTAEATVENGETVTLNGPYAGYNQPGRPSGLDYGEDGYDPGKCNVGVNGQTGLIQMEIKGLVEPKTDAAARICRACWLINYTGFACGCLRCAPAPTRSVRGSTVRSKP